MKGQDQNNKEEINNKEETDKVAEIGIEIEIGNIGIDRIGIEIEKIEKNIEIDRNRNKEKVSIRNIEMIENID